MNTKDYLLRIQADSTAALAQLPPDDVVIVKAGENLQAALDNGGNIQLEDGATFEGWFTVTKSGTTLTGTNAKLTAKAGGAPTIYIPPRVNDITLNLKTVKNEGDQSVIQVGTSDNTQTTEADCPDRITITAEVPTFRGKRPFYINGKNVTLNKCIVMDAWDPAQRDSQAVLIFNTPGPVTISEGHFEAGSENIMVGGDVTSIPNVQPKDILIKNVTLLKPLSWKTDGVQRKIKCLFELKAGVNVRLLDSDLSGCWVDAQTGWACMLTPRNGKEVGNILIENVSVENCGGFMSLLGYDNGEVGPQLHDVIVRNVNSEIISANNFGAGRFMQWTASPRNIIVEQCKHEGPGTTFYVEEGKTWVNGQPVTNGITHGVSVHNNNMSLNDYAIMILGNAYARNWQAGWPDGAIENNLFTAPTANVSGLKKNLPPSNSITGV